MPSDDRPRAPVTDDTDRPRCGLCAYFQAPRLDPGKGVVVGDCLGGQYPPVRPEHSLCGDFVPRGALAQKTSPKTAARARSGGGSSPQSVSQAHRAPLEIDIDMDEDTFRRVLREVLAEELALSEAPIAERYRGGELVVRAGREGLQDKRIPLEGFFRKVVLLRDRLRVLEQRINSHPKLTDEDRVSLQQYITQCYGSLTTFNILFREEGDRFVGASGSDKD